MKAVFDTNILIDYLNGVQGAADELSLYQEKIISVITHIEVLVGVEDTDEEPAVRAFLASFRLSGLSEHIAEETVRLRRQHRMKVPDAIVYATARTEGCLLVSRNRKDFKPEWPDVRVPYDLTD